MSEQAIALIISLACNFNSLGVTEERLDCMDFAVNCMMKYGKETTEDQAKDCAKRAKNGEKYAVEN